MDNIPKYVGSNSYKIKSQIGKGSFGQIFICEDMITKEEFACKLENSDAKYPQLANEYKIYSKLAYNDHIPSVHYYGTEGNKNILIMDLLGPSVEQQFKKRGHRLSVKTVLMIGIQMISCLETVHKRGYIHRDIKPENFCFGTGRKQNTLFIIDFGLSKKYVLPSGALVPWKDGKSFAGTARYGSIRALSGEQQSRRDDLESLVYVWIYLIKGVLPWMDIQESSRTLKHRRIAESKKSHSMESLCYGIPHEVVTYFDTVRNYAYDEDPDYEALRGLLKKALKSIGQENDLRWDWAPAQSAQRPVTKSASQNIALIETLGEDDVESDSFTPPRAKRAIKPIPKRTSAPQLVRKYTGYKYSDNDSDEDSSSRKKEIQKKHNRHFTKPPIPVPSRTNGRISHGSTPLLRLQSQKRSGDYDDDYDSTDKNYKKSHRHHSHHSNHHSHKRESYDYRRYSRKAVVLSSSSSTSSISSSSSGVDVLKYRRQETKPKVKSSVDAFLERRGITIPPRFLR